MQKGYYISKYKRYAMSIMVTMLVGLIFKSGIVKGQTVTEDENPVVWEAEAQGESSAIDVMDLYNMDIPVMMSAAKDKQQETNNRILQETVSENCAQIANEPYISRYTENSVVEYSEVLNAVIKRMNEGSTLSNDEVLNMITEVRNAKKLLVIKPENRPVPQVKNGVASVTLHGEILTIKQYINGIAFNGETFWSNGKGKFGINGTNGLEYVHMNQSGYYTFYVNDSFEDEFYLVVYYDSVTDIIEYIDISELSYELKMAQKLYDATATDTSDLPAGVTYTDPASKNALRRAISKATSAVGEVCTQKDVNDALDELKHSEEVFKMSLKTVEYVNVVVSGSTVYVTPCKGCKVGRVRYNVDSYGNMVQAIWGNWESFVEHPYTQKLSNFVWTNVPDGAYTFLICTYDAAGKAIWQLKTFVVADSSANAGLTTEQKERKQIHAFVETQTMKVQNVLNETSIASQVDLGQLSVQDAIYNNLRNVLAVTKAMLRDTSTTAQMLMKQSLVLTSAFREFESNIRPKEQLSHDIDITFENGMITLRGKGLFRASYIRGKYDTQQEFRSANCIPCYFKDDMISIKPSANGVYTFGVIFSDGVFEIRQISVEVFTYKEENEKILLHYTGSQEVIGTRYAYNDGSGNASYFCYNGLQEKLPVLGNGNFVVKVKYSDGQEDTLNISVSDCKKPVILVNPDYMMVFDYGFDIQSVMYAKGHFTSWEDMHESVYNVFEMNTPVHTKAFEKGEYTLLFVDKDGKQYIEYVTLQ